MYLRQRRQKAVEIAKGIVPNVIIMDIMMPNMDAYRLVNFLDQMKCLMIR